MTVLLLLHGGELAPVTGLALNAENGHREANRPNLWLDSPIDSDGGDGDTDIWIVRLDTRFQYPVTKGIHQKPIIAENLALDEGRPRVPPTRRVDNRRQIHTRLERASE